ncbi:alpha/beta fold hydrolase [Nonomuraea dietziae]|uniref:alpha/beta fold hydrolase n=1 Tax=Nonomuraea dietziae TaxID=65515 RepID=UPI00360BED3F
MKQANQIPQTHQRTVSSTDGTPISYQTIGAGPGLIVLGGALRTSQDYLPLASALARSFTVHVVDRRGRGASGPQGPQYTLGKEVEDLLAVQAETGARLAFGHSYGGLVILETARSFQVFERIAVYEPGVPVGPLHRLDGPLPGTAGRRRSLWRVRPFHTRLGRRARLRVQAAVLVSADGVACRVPRAELAADAAASGGQPGRARADGGPTRPACRVRGRHRFGAAAVRGSYAARDQSGVRCCTRHPSPGHTRKRARP